MYELQGPENRAWANIQNARTTGEAAAAIVTDFLRPAAQHRDRRVAEYLAGGPQISNRAATQSAQEPQSQYARLISAATGAPLESILAEYNIAPGQAPNFAPIGSPAQGVANAPMGGVPQIPGQPGSAPGVPQIPGQPGSAPASQVSQNALAMMGQEQEQPFRTNQNSLDPRMFMSRRRFQVIPNEVI